MALVTNSAGDERNPPEFGMMGRAVARIKNSRYL